MPPSTMLKKPPAYRFLVFFLMLLAYLLVYAGIQIIATLAVDIMSAVGIAEGKLSLLSAIGALTMALLSFVAGGLSTKYGGKKIVIIGLLVMAFSGILYLENVRNESCINL